MSIQYRFVPIYDNLNEDSEKVTGFYPKVVSRGTINKERMFEEISHGSSSLRSELGTFVDADGRLYYRSVERWLRCLPERFLYFRYLRQIPPCRPYQRNPSRIHFRKGHACPHFGGRQ